MNDQHFNKFHRIKSNPYFIIFWCIQRARDRFRDLVCQFSLLVYSSHRSIYLVHCSDRDVRKGPSGGIGSTNRFPWITFSASDAFFIAAIVSAFRFADSSVFTCISSCNRVPARRSSSASLAFFRFNAAVAAGPQRLFAVQLKLIRKK